MKRDDVYLRHILDAISVIEKFVHNVHEETFRKNRLIQDAVIRELEIIGGATKYVGESLKKKHPEIPWKEVGGMRDKLIHEYFGVDISLVWEVVQKDLPELKRKILTITRP